MKFKPIINNNNQNNQIKKTLDKKILKEKALLKKTKNLEKRKQRQQMGESDKNQNNLEKLIQRRDAENQNQTNQSRTVPSNEGENEHAMEKFAIESEIIRKQDQIREQNFVGDVRFEEPNEVVKEEQDQLDVEKRIRNFVQSENLQLATQEQQEKTEPEQKQPPKQFHRPYFPPTYDSKGKIRYGMYRREPEKADKIMLEVGPALKGRFRAGYVVSSGLMDKSITVAIPFLKSFPKYKLQLLRTRKFMVHDWDNEADTGDFVRIIHSRAYSKRKRWALFDIISKNKGAAFLRKNPDIAELVKPNNHDHYLQNRKGIKH